MSKSEDSRSSTRGEHAARQLADFLSVEELEQIDEICLQFEDAWKAGLEPTIQENLEQVPAHARSMLLWELVRLDVDYRARSGENLTPRDYEADFPDDADLLHQVCEAAVTLTVDDEVAPTIGVSTPSSVSSLPLPDQVGPYRLEDEIGRGGMGIVFRAKDVRLKRSVALKMIRDSSLASEEAVRRFHTEAQAAAKLEHEGIVAVHEVGQASGVHYFSMAYIDGESLEDRLRRQNLSPEQVARLLSELADAVHFAHEHGVVHRDLKPANILLDAESRPKITDFGLAKLMQDGDDLTATGQILGTPGYMPPEQVSGQHALSGPAADIYALGAILYRMLTGRPPFQSDTLIESMFEVLEKEPIPPRAIDRSVPESLEAICLKCLSKSPKHRYQSAAMLADELRRFLNGEPIRAQPPRWSTRLFVWARQRPALVVTLVGLPTFYCYHLAATYLWEKSDLSFHWLASGVVACWLVSAFLFQRWLLRPASGVLPMFCWSASELFFLTVMLAHPQIDGPLSPLALLYLVMTAGSALRGGRRLVGFVYACSLIGFCTLVVVFLNRPIPPDREDLKVIGPDHFIPFVLCLSLIALIQYFLVLQRQKRPS